MSGKPRRRAVAAGSTGLLWRALLSAPPAEWQQLSMITRGIAAEIMRRLDASNAIVCAPGRSIHEAVFMVCGAHPNERRRIKEAVDELIAGRWATAQPGRLEVHFPDLGGTRPSVAPDSNASTAALNTAEPLMFDSESAPAESVEEKRGRGEEEERRGEGARTEEVIAVWDPMVWTPTSAMLRAEFKKHGIVFTDLVGPSWTKVVNWTLDFSEAIGKPGSYVITNLALGFAKNEKARLHGYPLSYVVTNPRQFYEEGVVLTGEVVFENEENPF